MASVGTSGATFFIDILDVVDACRRPGERQRSGIGARPAEAAMLRLAEQAGVPVPAVIAVSDDLPGVGALVREGRTVPATSCAD